MEIVKFAYRYDSKLNTNRAKIKETIWARDHFNSDFADSGDSGDSAGSTGSSGSGSGSDGGSGGSVGSACDDAIDVCLGTSLNDENFTGESNMFGSDIGGSNSEGETLYRGSTTNLADREVEIDEEGYGDEQTIAIACLAEIEKNGNPEERPYALLGSLKKMFANDVAFDEFLNRDELKAQRKKQPETLSNSTVPQIDFEMEF
ncbi:unnamed protein product [Ambrosiozyma monospora]|uniref:Unnamed protein product n=1 Tax=Ambrosiozyma monospora TaxID=43982 RepID=A0A9W6Z792_AMBMO|nr:unnamed protein product [Ambrosiozyma monospora]